VANLANLADQATAVLVVSVEYLDTVVILEGLVHRALKVLKVLSQAHLTIA
jgi:hypothetical protein